MIGQEQAVMPAVVKTSERHCLPATFVVTEPCGGHEASALQRGEPGFVVTWRRIFDFAEATGRIRHRSIDPSVAALLIT